MAKKKSRQDELFERLRAGGLTKRAARAIAAASDKADSKRLRKAVEDLRGLVGELESRVGGAVGVEPKEEGSPAARTRGTAAGNRGAPSAAAAKRSAAAKKAAATRAANRARAANDGAATAPRPAPPSEPARPPSDD